MRRVLALAVFLTLLLAAPSSAYHYTGNHWIRDAFTGGGENQPLIKEFFDENHWQSELFVNVTQNFNVSPRIESAIEWHPFNPAQCPIDRNTFAALGPAPPYYTMEACHDMYWYPQYGEGSGWCGLYAFFSVGGQPEHTYSSRIYFNDFYDPAACGLNHRGLVCHELGHAYSLHHMFADQWSEGSCMRRGGGAGEWLNAHDHWEIETVYNFWDGDGRHPGDVPCGNCPNSSTAIVMEAEGVKNPTFGEYMSLRKLEQRPGAIVWWREPFERLSTKSRQKLEDLQSERKRFAEHGHG